MTDVAALEAEIEGLREAWGRLEDAVAARWIGPRRVIQELSWAVLGGGHALIEGVPGIGKTTLVKAFAGSLGLSFGRVQCTPDLVPGDVLGTRILEHDEHGRARFHFEPGPVFTQVLLADEVNRATPRTQSALLEAMQEGQVTSHGETRALPAPFVVVATENPIEMEGTFPLPEAQLDRFLLQVAVGLPSEEELRAVLAAAPEGAPPEPLLEAAAVLRLRALVREVPASEAILRSVARAVRATHPAAPEAPAAVRRAVRHGASPRGALAWLAAARARALLAGRVHVAEEDLAAAAGPCLRHRLVLSYEGEAEGAERADLVAEALAVGLGR